jgi:hypothetical protein
MGSGGDVVDRYVYPPYNTSVFHLKMIAVKYFSPTTNLCIIRVARDHHRIAWGAVTLLTSIHDIKVIPRVIHVSGMLIFLCLYRPLNKSVGIPNTL